MSWLRSPGGTGGLVLLTVGDEVYAGDPRLRVHRPVLSMVSRVLIDTTPPGYLNLVHYIAHWGSPFINFAGKETRYELFPAPMVASD